MSRIGTVLAAALWLAFGALGAQAADIQDRGQAFDRFIALAGPAGQYSAYYATQDSAAAAAAAGMEISANEPGWLFAARKSVNSRDAYLLGFVHPDGAMARRTVKALPPGMEEAPPPKTTNSLTPVSTRDQAYDLLVHGLLGHSTQGKRIWALDAKVEKPAVIKTMGGEIRIDAGPGWLFFIDDLPRANWEHPCRYVLVLEKGGMDVQASRAPPDSMEGFTELTEPPAKVSHVQFPASHERDRSLPRNSGAGVRNGDVTPAGDRYAVIISGGYKPDKNYIRYWNDCAFFYNTLMDNGFADENVHVLMADGTDPDVDNPDGEDSPIDLDGDGDPDIQYSATKANIATVFDELQGILDSEDYLYIFTTDHGANRFDNPPPYETPGAILYLWGEYITDAEFAAEVNKVTTAATVCIFEQCFSGGMIDDLEAPNRVLMSASRFWEYSWSMFSGEYDEFSYHVTVSLSDPGAGDSNGDGEVTLEEAYLYALANDACQSEELHDEFNDGEHPSYYSNPWDLGRRLSLGGRNDNFQDPVYAGYTQREIEDAFSENGAPQGWQGDDACWEYQMPFSFPFGARKYDSLNVCSNGHITFDAAVTDPWNEVDKLKAGKGIAPLWDGLQATDIHVEESASWVAFRWEAETTADSRPVNVAAQLFSSGAIRFLYGPGNDHTSLVEGRDKTIGISLGDGQDYHLCLRNGSGNLGSAKGIEFLPDSRKPSAALPAIRLLLLE